MPMSPTKISSRSSSWASRALGGPLWLRWATASTRRALAARSLPTPRMRRRSASVMGRGPWGPCTWVQRESTASGAPFTAMRVPPAGRLWQVAIRLRTRIKGGLSLAGHVPLQLGLFQSLPGGHLGNGGLCGVPHIAPGSLLGHPRRGCPGPGPVPADRGWGSRPLTRSFDFWSGSPSCPSR